MANIDMMGASYGQGMTVTDARWTPMDVVDPVAVVDFTATQDIRTIDARLTALNAAYWTPLRLAQESTWDKLFYIRSQTPAGLA